MRTVMILLGCLLLFGVGGAHSREVTLDGFLALVEQHSKELKLADQDVAMARAQQSEATSLALPHVSAQAVYNRNLRDTYMYADLGELTGEPGSIQKMRINYDNEYAFGVTATQTIFSGQVFSAIKAAGQYRQLTDFIYDATWQQLITGAKQAFSQTLLLEVVWEVAQDAEQNALENFEGVTRAYQSGLVSEFEMLQAEVRYKDAIPQTTAARRNYEVALVALKNLAGIPVDDELSLLGSLDECPPMPTETPMDSVLAVRPDYRAFQWEERLRKTNVRAQQAAYFPSLAAVAAYNYSAQSNEWRLENENNSVTVGLNLSIPIFQGGETRAKVRQARVDLEKARVRREQARQDIAKEAKSARLRMEEAAGRIESAHATLETARKAFSIAETTSRSGLTTQLQLKDSRIALDRATLNYYSAVFEYLVALYDWDLVTGTVEPARSVR